MSTALEPLAAGQRMGRVEFHERYEAMPPGTTFELIDGKVYQMPSPVTDLHGDGCGLASGWLNLYALRTPGVRVGHAGSVFLGDRSEVQPDLMLKVDPACGGLTRRQGRYLDGCPELVVEVSLTTQATDLGPKLAAYDSAGALSYIVFALDPAEIHWHARQGGRLVRVEPDADGLYRSAAFPGLWLDPAAWFAEDLPRLAATIDRGLASPEHAAFVARLNHAAGR